MNTYTTTRPMGGGIAVPQSNVIFHAADSRSHAAHGWLDSWHSFSFANYYNPDRMSFGVLRVLNDDTVAAGMGFGKHPHNNMEIISIPLEGDLEHGDNMGNRTIIRQGDVQVMSAGTGVIHSEKNASSTDAVKFLQIWVFPKEQNVKPRYDQQSFLAEALDQKLATVVSPLGTTDGGVQINQDAWFRLGKLTAGQTLDYRIKKEGNGLYVFLLEGEIVINGVEMKRRDGAGFIDLKQIQIDVTADAHLLLMEVPMA